MRMQASCSCFPLSHFVMSMRGSAVGRVEVDRTQLHSDRRNPHAFRFLSVCCKPGRKESKCLHPFNLSWCCGTRHRRVGLGYRPGTSGVPNERTMSECLLLGVK